MNHWAWAVTAREASAGEIALRSASVIGRAGSVVAGASVSDHDCSRHDGDPATVAAARRCQPIPRQRFDAFIVVGRLGGIHGRNVCHRRKVIKRVAVTGNLRGHD
jgi:hypothetical protein